MGSVSDYQRSVAESQAWFRANHANVATAFQVLDQGFEKLGQLLQSGRDADNKTHVSLGPLLMLLRRQAFVALDALTSRQSFQAWLLVRPGIESALFMGKWMDSVENYQAWDGKSANWKRYQAIFSGGALVSKSLPGSHHIQLALKSINDAYAHPNPDYYMRHLRYSRMANDDILVELKFFDEDWEHWASVLGLLHLLIVVQDALAKMFAARFVNCDVVADDYGLTRFQSSHAIKAREAAAVNSQAAFIVNDLGLWHLAQ